MNNREKGPDIWKDFKIRRLVVYINQEQKRSKNRSLRNTWSDSFSERSIGHLKWISQYIELNRGSGMI